MTHVKIEVNKVTKLVVAKDCLTNFDQGHHLDGK